MADFKSVNITNSAGWAVNVINTAGITLGASTLVAGSIRTLQYSAESVGLVAGSVVAGSIRTLQYAPESTQLVAGVAYVGTMAITGTTYTLLLPSSAGINAGLAVIGSVRTLQYAAESTQLVAGVNAIGTASVILMNTANWYVNVVNTAGWIVKVANTGGEIGLYSGTGLIGTMNTLAIGGGDTVSVVNSNNWAVFLNAGSMLVGTMNTLAIGGGDTVSVVNSANWSVNLAVGSALIGTTNIIGQGGFISVVNTAGITLGAASVVAGSIRTLQYAAESTQIVAGVAAIGTASVILMNTANWYVNVVNTAGVTLGAASVVVGSIRTLQYATESMSLVAGAALAGSMRTLQFAPESTQLVAGVAFAGTMAILGSVHLAANNVLAGSIRTLQYSAESVGLVAGSVVAGSIRTLQYAAESVGLVAGAAVIGTAYALLLPSSASINAGVASIGTASVILMNTGNWTVSNRPEVMSMASSNVIVYSYSTGIECSATNNLIISASASRIFKVLGYSLMAGVANIGRFQSGTGGTTPVTGSMFFGASGGIVMPYNPMGWFQTTAGSPLYLLLATANSVGGVISYVVM